MDSTGASAAGADAGPGSNAIPSYNTHNLKLDPSIRDWGKKLNNNKCCMRYILLLFFALFPLSRGAALTLIITHLRSENPDLSSYMHLKKSSFPSW